MTQKKIKTHNNTAYLKMFKKGKPSKVYEKILHHIKGKLSAQDAEEGYPLKQDLPKPISEKSINLIFGKKKSRKVNTKKQRDNI